MENQHNINIASLKAGAIWLLVAIGALPWLQILQGTALVLAIVYSALQIYKIRRDIKRDQETERFAKDLGVATRPTPL